MIRVVDVLQPYFTVGHPYSIVSRTNLPCLALFLQVLCGVGVARVHDSTLFSGWAGTYRGTATTVEKTWTTEYAERAEIEPFSLVDTTALDAPVTVVIDTSDTPFSHGFVRIKFENRTVVIRSYDRMHHTGESLSIWQQISFGGTIGVTFHRRGDTIAGDVRWDSHPEYGAIHSSETTQLSIRVTSATSARVLSWGRIKSSW